MTVQLENLRKGEVVDIVIRRHWIVFIMLFVFFIGAIFFSAIIVALF